MEKEWGGFNRIDFDFKGRHAVVVFAKKPREGQPWMLKTEYFEAFPAFEFEMLAEGYSLAYVANKTRWHVEEDDEIRHEFCMYLNKTYGFSKKCIPVGMSCGGLHAVYFASKYPQDVSALYLDAPVLNLLSCPCGFGVATEEFDMYDEFVAETGITASELLNYRNHPIDRVSELISNRIPVALICGGSDKTVPYVENGKILSEKYSRTDVPFLEQLDPGRGHHPHGPQDAEALKEFLIRYTI